MNIDLYRHIDIYDYEHEARNVVNYKICFAYHALRSSTLYASLLSNIYLLSLKCFLSSGNKVNEPPLLTQLLQLFAMQSPTFEQKCWFTKEYTVDILFSTFFYDCLKHIGSVKHASATVLVSSELFVYFSVRRFYQYNYISLLSSLQEYLFVYFTL